MVHILEVYRYWLIFGLVLAENLGSDLVLVGAAPREAHFTDALLIDPES